MRDLQDIKGQFIDLWKESGKEKVFKIRGTSMQPLIRESDTISVRPILNAADLRIGDIAVFKGTTGIVAHRIVGKFKIDNACYLREKGDYKQAPTVVPAELIIGKVVKIYRPDDTINLSSSLWYIINSVVGHYWQALFVILDLVSAIKTKRLGTTRIPLITAAYLKLTRLLIQLPTIIFRRK